MKTPYAMPTDDEFRVAESYVHSIAHSVANRRVHEAKDTIMSIKGYAMYILVRTLTLVTYKADTIEHLFTDFERDHAYKDVLEMNEMTG